MIGSPGPPATSTFGFAQGDLRGQCSRGSCRACWLAAERESGVGRGVSPRPQPQTGRASFQASGFPDNSTLIFDERTLDFVDVHLEPSKLKNISVIQSRTIQTYPKTHPALKYYRRNGFTA